MLQLKCPDLDSITPGSRYLYRAKIGGERQLINVIVKSGPYLRNFGKGRASLYVDAFGYGWSGTVQTKKLRQIFNPEKTAK